ncbi:beta family protein [Streptomyces sp. 8N114]|uniref:beta family protein n=1 Tax=Streptomyces sp. 8N114 TaxID=3457419 RepID=UPI003FD2862E
MATALCVPVYVPGLPVRASGLKAFTAVAAAAKRRTAPFWVIPPRVARAPTPSGELEPDGPAALAAYLHKQSDALRERHGLHPGWVDARHMEDTLPLVHEHVWSVLCSDLLGCALRPVTGPERDPAQQRAAGAVGAEWGNGLGVRVREADVGEAAVHSLPERLKALTVRTGVPPEETDIVVDLHQTDAVDSVVKLGRAAWNATGGSAPWRTVVLLCGSFPWGTELLKDYDVTSLLRVEWVAWQRLHTDGEGPRGDPRFVYGDYGTAAPRACDAPAETEVRNAYEKPRYTTSEYFLVGKGRPVRNGHDSRIQELAERLVTDPEFRVNHSGGEDWLQERAADTENRHPGHPETWARQGYIQHLTYVPEQLAELNRRATDA